MYFCKINPREQNPLTKKDAKLSFGEDADRPIYGKKQVIYDVWVVQCVFVVLGCDFPKCK